MQKRSNRRTKIKKKSLSDPTDDDSMEIPGFYYDQERDRYFKIMPGHHFGTNTSGVEVKKQPDSNVSTSTKPRISTCSSLLNEREFNPFKTIQRLHRDWREIFVKSLRYVGTIQQTIPFSLSHRITNFQIHPTSNELYFGNTDGMVGLLKFQASSKACTEIFSKPFAYCNSEICILKESNGKFVLNSQITSIRIIGESLIIYTSLGNHLCSGILRIEHLPEVTDFDMVHGATKYISILSNYSVPGARFTNVKTNSDVFALDNDRYLPSAIFAGCRDGRLLLFDIRCNPKQSSPHGDGPRIKQSSPICNLKQVSGWYVLGDGMDGSLSLWDIRNQRRNQNTEESTLPVLKYYGHVNSTKHQTGFAVNSCNSIVAIAGQDNFVRFFSINTGDVVRMPIGPFEDRVSAIQFCERDEKSNYEFLPDGDNEHYNKGEGIWISIGKELQWW
ncbi:33303_t:CDS:10, partial [Gigaspora margarita]